MTQPDLFSAPIREMAPASLESWDRICWTLTEREIAVFLLVARCLDETGARDVTGGELAHWSGMSIVSCRPRLTGLQRKGWLHSFAMRASRRPDEQRCHPYALALPASAIERARNTRKAAEKTVKS